MFSCVRLQKIEDETRKLHHYLDSNDECYFLGEYTSYQDYNFSNFNNLIFNLKKPPGTKSTNQNAYRYKLQAIECIASCLRQLIKQEALESSLTIVPIPPSKTSAHPEYDDRTYRICIEMVSGLQTPDVKELIKTKFDMEATHNQAAKPTPNELMYSYQIVVEPDYRPRSTILLVDDMLTTGTHFKACKNLLLSAYTNIEIIGIFVTRRIFAN